MLTLKNIKKIVGELPMGSFYDVEAERGIGEDELCDTVCISNASEWSFDEMKLVSEALNTKEIDMLGTGCDTCGHGATIEVRNIDPFYKVVKR